MWWTPQSMVKVEKVSKKRRNWKWQSDTLDLKLQWSSNFSQNLSYRLASSGAWRWWYHRPDGGPALPHFHPSIQINQQHQQHWLRTHLLHILGHAVGQLLIERGQWLYLRHGCEERLPKHIKLRRNQPCMHAYKGTSKIRLKSSVYKHIDVIFQCEKSPPRSLSLTSSPCIDAALCRGISALIKKSLCSSFNGRAKPGRVLFDPTGLNLQTYPLEVKNH